MLNLIKPGYVLRFGTCPSTVISPSWTGVAHQTAQAFPNTPLGNVTCLWNPSGNINAISKDVFNNLASYTDRAASYFWASTQDVQIGAATADFVGYTDGYTNCIQSNNMVFSKDFSGCLMVSYDIAGVRHVAHAAANATPTMDCKQAFLTWLQGQHAALVGW